ncbi:hypothetical protein KR222_001637 [Zaprionus bogoriensis]|nr:hypothetical protein KR222_001637 [Zaprionus bogoriensis]
MQPQSDKQSAIKSKFATTTTARRANIQQQPEQEHHQQQLQHSQLHKSRSKVKVIKSKRPLCHFKFYLDICDHQLTKRIEADIKALGGSLEFFLNDSITHFITDKEKSSLPLGSTSGAAQQTSNSLPGTPGTPVTPSTSTLPTEDGITGTAQRKSRQTRADAILSRARVIQQQCKSASFLTGPKPSQHQKQEELLTASNNSIQTAVVAKHPCGSYTVWQTAYALRFLQRIQTELRQYLQGASLPAAGTSPGNIQLKRNFIKIESIKRSHRPYYHLLKQQEEWPKIDLSSEDGAFRLQAKADVQSMTRKSLGSRTSQRQQQQDKEKDLPQVQIQPKQLPLQYACGVQSAKKHLAAPLQAPDTTKTHCREAKESSDKQCGVCEICKVEYDILTLHLQSKDHELFAKNADNFLALDTLIQVSAASVSDFLAREEQHTQQTNNSSGNSKNNSNISNSGRQHRPSPVLREKSKRITKGKHSSEKFQATPTNLSVNSPAQAQTALPSRKPTTPSRSILDLDQFKPSEGNASAAAVTTSGSTSRRKTLNSVLSPPFRAMLPPSSLYKVVEASDVLATPSRVKRGAGANSAAGNVTEAPSLIVKFQKVRQSELQRLNGEAENFMFPRTTTRSSSEIATDIDRQTTSDIRGHYSISSASIDTTSESEMPCYQSLSVTNSTTATATTANSQHKRATAVGRRRKEMAKPPVASAAHLAGNHLATSSGGVGVHQKRFPNAPIQPEMQPQLLKPRLRQATTATRKSSRTATAIVTAATTSSQLQLRRQTQIQLNSSRRGGKLEDGMGEQAPTTKKLKINLEHNHELNKVEDDGDDDDEEFVESSFSSGSDEDYVAIGNLSKGMPKSNCVDTRGERATRRLMRLTVSINRSEAGEAHNHAPLSPTSENRSPTGRNSGKNIKQATATATALRKASKEKAAPTIDLMFDCSKSERLLQMRYEFEKLPSADLWHRVFQRQDSGEEHYYCYYGSTRYRKLPYELGPIPMELTKPHNCTLCQQQFEAKTESKSELLTEKGSMQQGELSTAATSASMTTSTVYKHKKLNLLQRYQQDQPQAQAALKAVMPVVKFDSKASTPELLEHDLVPLSEQAQIGERVRATSTQSSSSSSCSNSQKSSGASRHKQLTRLVELPPRKSPREHASTLALVSCIIRQRQDSQSKTNSDAEDPPLATTTPNSKVPLKQDSALATATTATHNTRLQTATPVEEMRFATEISETVKRMRRGQNKYDTLPRASTPVRSRRPTPANSDVSYSRRLQLVKREAANSGVLLGKRNRRQLTITPGMRPSQQQPPGTALFAGVRKLSSKKGLLEYEMEKSAFNALNTNMNFVNPTLIAWEIDKYLERTGQEYDPNVEEEQIVLQPMERETSTPSTFNASAHEEVQTPPSTDCCFTSEFDLCDLLTGNADSGDDDGLFAGRSSCRGRGSTFSFFSGHQRKRKCLKSNRTGWPRVQRRRGTVVTNVRLLQNEQFDTRGGSGQKDIRATAEESHRDIKQEPLETEEEQTSTTTTTADKEINNRQDDDDDNDDRDPGYDPRGNDREILDKEQPACREETTMTPPATDVEEHCGVDNNTDNEAASAADIESQVEYDDDETMADLVDNQNFDAEIEATDADVEDDAEDEDDVYEDAYGEETKDEDELTMQELTISYTNEADVKHEAQQPIPKGQSIGSSLEKKLAMQQTSNRYCLNVTSTPSTQPCQQQQLERRTPQLNGSVESCISPTEKLGDNSDIFTVSSDGLDTDLDLSNTQAGDSLEHCSHSHKQQQQTTPKCKFDISKYAPPKNGKAASSCAAEAATAAVKSLAISQFLKKEVRVTCRRLRAPFRRFRYRR